MASILPGSVVMPAATMRGCSPRVPWTWRRCVRGSARCVRSPERPDGVGLDPISTSSLPANDARGFPPLNCCAPSARAATRASSGRSGSAPTCASSRWSPPASACRSQAIMWPGWAPAPHHAHPAFRVPGAARIRCGAVRRARNGQGLAACPSRAVMNRPPGRSWTATMTQRGPPGRQLGAHARLAFPSRSSPFKLHGE